MARPAPTEPESVADTFEADLAAIKEKGKDLKGEQREFYQSIVDRVANNVAVLASLRAEHTQLRKRLESLTGEQKTLRDRTTLESDIKHTTHEVNLLKKQIDKIRRDKVISVERQTQLEIVKANFARAESQVHPEEARIADMKDSLDRATIKTNEATHLFKLYEQIEYLLGRQKMRWEPAMRAQQEIGRQKDRDISELGLIARDSRFSRDLATSEYIRTRQQCSDDAQKRTRTLDERNAQQAAILARQQTEAFADHAKAAKPQQSLNSQPSVLRNKQNKAAREKREEKFRQAAGTYEEVRDQFGTTDPDRIAALFRERRETSATLEKQIEDLRVACAALERRAAQLRSLIEEAEYASSKGVGGARLIAEGEEMLTVKEADLTSANRELASTEQHHKRVSAGISHLADVMAMIRGDEEEMRAGRDQLLQWIREKCVMMKERAEQALTGDEIEPKKVKKPDQARRQKAGDVFTRVLDRNTVKMQAIKAAVAAQKKPTK
jgi:hypothetical protein